MLRYGNITEIDPQSGFARVTFTDDGIVSDWLQIVTRGAISDKDSFTFAINEQVACLMDEHSEDGVILGALFNSKSKSNVGDGISKILYSDGSFVQYNKNSNEYTIDVKGKINILASENIEINSVSKVDIKSAAEISIEAPVIQLIGAVAVTGALAVSGAITGASGAPIQGDLEVTGDVKAGDITLKTHKHLGVTTGGGISGLPTI